MNNDTLEPIEAFPYRPPGPDIREKYSHIFNLTEPLKPRYLKLFFDKCVAVICLFFCLPVIAFLKLGFLVEGWIYPENNELPQKSVYFVSSRHDEFKDLSKIENSIIIDPWRFVEKTHSTSKLIKMGINLKGNDNS